MKITAYHILNTGNMDTPREYNPAIWGTKKHQIQVIPIGASLPNFLLNHFLMVLRIRGLNLDYG